MADEEKKLTDQFNILFDDITDDLTDDVKEGAEEIQEKAEEIVSDVSEAASDAKAELSEVSSGASEAAAPLAEDALESGEELYNEVDHAFSDAEDAFSEAVTEAGDLEEALKAEIPEKQRPKDKKPFVREDPKSLLDELNQEDEDRYEDDEADDLDEDESPRKRKVNKPPYDDANDRPRRKGMSSENLRFWIFTAIVALLVIAAVLFILYKRGIIFKHDETTPAVTTLAPTEATQPTTLAPVETTTAAPEETTTAAPEETTTEVPEEVREVLNHYTNLFVVRDKVGDTEVNYLNIRAQASPEANPIARIARYGGGEVLEDGAEWVKISSAGYVGYVKKEYVATGEEAKEMALQRADKYVRCTAENGLRIRSMPSTTGEIVTTVPNGAIMIYEGEENGFYHINYGDQFDGYVSADHAVYEWLLMGAIPNE